MTARAPADIRCSRVVHLYPTDEEPVVALRNVDLYAAEGELLAILGPSGSGKSTLLGLLSGLLTASAGRVTVAGHDLGRLQAAGLRRLRATELALLLQQPSQNLLPYATVAQNVGFAQRGARRRRWERCRPVPEVLDLLGLAGAADRVVSTLSAGEQQRAALATVVATGPRVLLADEPTGRLDPDARDQVIAALHRVHDTTGVTTVVVTHDSRVAAALPRSVTIRDGVLGTEGRGARQYAVVAGDGTVQLPPDVLEAYPPGTLLRVTAPDGRVELRPAPRERRPGDGERAG